ncbi:MAG: dethiobiotin synthetase, partial [Cyclobacteriaceae bacterium]
GGIMVPINDEDYVIDVAARLEMPIILVANLYLGSINHTLLSLQYLENRNLAVEGVIFNGPVNEESQQIIKAKCRWPILLHVPQEAEVNQSMVRKYAKELKQKWKRAS